MEMLIDLLNASSYIMINTDAIKYVGLTNAAYCTELITIFKKAVKKKKTYNDVYFKIDRAYITDRLGISAEEQIKCDINLAKIDVIKVSKDDRDIITIDIEKYASLIASEDVKLQQSVSKKVNTTNPKGMGDVKKEKIAKALKESIECRTPEVLYALYDWIDALIVSKALSKVHVKLFKETLDNYCNGDLKKALEIIRIATIHNWVDCQWAINSYESGNTRPNTNRTPAVNQVRVTEQKRSTELGDEIF